MRPAEWPARLEDPLDLGRVEWLVLGGGGRLYNDIEFTRPIVDDREAQPLLIELGGHLQIRVGWSQLAGGMVVDHERPRLGIPYRGQDCAPMASGHRSR